MIEEVREERLEIVVTNPYNGEEVGRVPCASAMRVGVTASRAMKISWLMRRMPLHQRAECLFEISRQMLQKQEELARTVTLETGKTIRETRAEVNRAALIFQIAGEEARRLHGETVPFDGLPNGIGRMGYYVREPVGIVAAITPWNVPLALAAHKIAPALAGGNAVIWKPAEQTPLSALLLGDVLKNCGLPENAVQVVIGYGDDVGDALVTSRWVNFVSFTGSREVGMNLPARAGFKKIALELGGNSPVIVTQSADLQDAANQIVMGAFAVAGQLCISVQRVIVHKSVHDALLAELLPKVAALKMGDPMDESTDVGTLINAEACDRVASQVVESLEAGATLHIGGTRVGRSGYAPTVLSNPHFKAAIKREEAFAPLVLVRRYRNFEQAIEFANETPYGLNAGVFTNDLNEAFRAAREIEAGTVLINDVPTFRSELMPYGGRKQSGLGREGVRFALEEMTELKTVCFR